MVPRNFIAAKTAKQLTDDMAQNGGLITMEDLAAYKAKMRQPLKCELFDWRRQVGRDHQPAAKFRRHRDDRGDEYSRAPTIKGMERRNLSALGGRSDAPSIR